VECIVVSRHRGLWNVSWYRATHARGIAPPGALLSIPKCMIFLHILWHAPRANLLNLVR
jgi:hypothetical protein